jgi:outer membrane protein assembly factor BamE (lipoprotein component of BamABCDE complex)
MRIKYFLYAVCVGSALSFSLMACAMQDTQSFDSVIWKAQRGVDLRQNKRLAMLDDLETKLHTGMGREQVIELLGPPDASDAKSSTDTYELGVSSVGIDGEVYRVEYRDGKVAAHRWSRW